MGFLNFFKLVPSLYTCESCATAVLMIVGEAGPMAVCPRCAHVEAL